jgi:CheY-like chemotaxis protein
VTRRVLIVDDDDSIRLIAGKALTKLGGFEVLEAPDGAAGVELAASERPDVILLDVMMPGLDGPATLVRLRERADTAAIPVVLLTAKADARERDHLSSLGAAAVLTKPFDPLTLHEDLAAALGWGAA